LSASTYLVTALGFRVPTPTGEELPSALKGRGDVPRSSENSASYIKKMITEAPHEKKGFWKCYARFYTIKKHESCEEVKKTYKDLYRSYGPFTEDDADKKFRQDILKNGPLETTNYCFDESVKDMGCSSDEARS